MTCFKGKAAAFSVAMVFAVLMFALLCPLKAHAATMTTVGKDGSCSYFTVTEAKSTVTATVTASSPASNIYTLALYRGNTLVKSYIYTNSTQTIKWTNVSKGTTIFSSLADRAQRNTL